jgi:sucrose-6-phosphate hydrolase SacC (GH32 family)
MKDVAARDPDSGRAIGSRWASVYMNRAQSSLAAATDAGPSGYGLFPYAGLVQILPEDEAAVKLSVFVDRSIVETFAMGGRAALTGRVYPSLADADRIGVYSSGGVRGVNATAWEMGPAVSEAGP